MTVGGMGFIPERLLMMMIIINYITVLLLLFYYIRHRRTGIYNIPVYQIKTGIPVPRGVHCIGEAGEPHPGS